MPTHDHSSGAEDALETLRTEVEEDLRAGEVDADDVDLGGSFESPEHDVAPEPQRPGESGEDALLADVAQELDDPKNAKALFRSPDVFGFDDQGNVDTAADSLERSAQESAMLLNDGDSEAELFDDDFDEFDDVDAILGLLERDATDDQPEATVGDNEPDTLDEVSEDQIEPADIEDVDAILAENAADVDEDFGCVDELIQDDADELLAEVQQELLESAQPSHDQLHDAPEEAAEDSSELDAELAGASAEEVPEDVVEPKAEAPAPVSPPPPPVASKPEKKREPKAGIEVEPKKAKRKLPDPVVKVASAVATPMDKGGSWINAQLVSIGDGPMSTLRWVAMITMFNAVVVWSMVLLRSPGAAQPASADEAIEFVDPTAQ